MPAAFPLVIVRVPVFIAYENSTCLWCDVELRNEWDGRVSQWCDGSWCLIAKGGFTWCLQHLENLENTWNLGERFEITWNFVHFIICFTKCFILKAFSNWKLILYTYFIMYWRLKRTLLFWIWIILGICIIWSWQKAMHKIYYLHWVRNLIQSCLEKDRFFPGKHLEFEIMIAVDTLL